jgi:hypothetical protein
VELKTENINQSSLEFKSTWEALYAIYLDDNNLKWDYEKHRIRYIDNGKKRTYVPDFYVHEHDAYYEIKGFYSDKMQKKMSLVNEQNDHKIIILRQKDLIQMNVLPRNYANHGVNKFIREHPKLNQYNEASI